MTKKTTAKKKTTPKRTASRAAKRVTPVPVHQKQFLLAEQQDFHRDHPNAERLLMVFIGAVLVLVALYLSKYGFGRMTY